MKTNVAPFLIDPLITDRRRDGFTDEQIANELDVSLGYVQAIPLPKPKPERSRAVQHLQLTQMARTLMPKVEAGDLNAIGLMLKVMQREATLLGLDAPKEVVNKNFNIDGDVDEDIAKMTLPQLKARVLELAKAGEVGVTAEGEFYVITPEQSEPLCD